MFFRVASVVQRSSSFSDHLTDMTNASAYTTSVVVQRSAVPVSAVPVSAVNVSFSCRLICVGLRTLNELVMGMVTFVWLVVCACEILLMDTSLLCKPPLSVDKCHFCRNLTSFRLGRSAFEMLLQGPIQMFRHLHT